MIMEKELSRAGRLKCTSFELKGTAIGYLPKHARGHTEFHVHLKLLITDGI